VGTEQTGTVLGIIAPPVGRPWLHSLGCVGFIILGKGAVLCTRSLQVAGEDVEQEAVVRGTLNVGLTAKSVDTSAGHADIPQQKLDHGHCPDILGPNCVLGPAHGVHDSTGAVGLTCRCVGLVDLK